MKQTLLIFFTLIFYSINAQVIEQATTPQNLPNLIPGFSQVSTINVQSLNFTYTLSPDDPQPIDGDIAIVSKTRKIKTSELSKVAAALQKQATRALGPIWEIQATVDASKN